MSQRADRFTAIVDAGLGILLAIAILSLAYCEAHAQTIAWHDASGHPVPVLIKQEDCPGYPQRGCAQMTVYLGGNHKRLAHELAHVAGMRHGAWRKNAFGTECAVVTVAGYQTGYEVGDLICAGMDGSDVVWKRSP